MDILETHSRFILPEPNSGCWLWDGSAIPQGYGNVRHNGRSVLAHRLSWFLFHGYWPERLLHRCDVPACVNPGHLFEGTQSENMLDMVKKNRGGQCQRRKLTMD